MDNPLSFLLAEENRQLYELLVEQAKNEVLGKAVVLSLLAFLIGYGSVVHLVKKYRTGNDDVPSIGVILFSLLFLLTYTIAEGPAMYWTAVDPTYRALELLIAIQGGG